MAEEQTYINHSPTAPTGGLVEASRPSISGYRTILDDATNYHVKHPLQSHWTLHQKLGAVEGASSRGVSQDAWADSLKESVTIGTVEDFWWYLLLFGSYW
jgi:hypothetical protein